MPASAEGTKKALVLAMLRRPQGATLVDLVRATGSAVAQCARLPERRDYQENGVAGAFGKRADGVRVYSVPRVARSLNSMQIACPALVSPAAFRWLVRQP